MDGVAAGQACHRFPGNFFVITYAPLQIKNPCSPIGEQGQKRQISAVPPCLLIKSAASKRCQHTVCPLTLALRQKILWKIPFPPALGGPFTASLFAPLSAPGTLCGCALQFYFRFNGFCIQVMPVIQQTCAFVKNYFSSVADRCQYSRTTPRTMPMISAWVPSMGE